MTERPVIGLTTSVEEGEQRVDLRYVTAIERAGGLPMLLPTAGSEETARAVVELVDGLVVPGGPAITAGLDGTLPDDIDEPDPRRVQSDRWILSHHRRRARPVLGICYGMQLLNAEAGGSIWADVQEQVAGTAVHSGRRGARAHPIRIEPDTHLHAILGHDEMLVNTYHIQAVKTVGDGLRVCARSPDGVIEAIENGDGTVIGVQFHPERQIDDMLPLFRALVARATSR